MDEFVRRARSLIAQFRLLVLYEHLAFSPRKVHKG